MMTEPYDLQQAIDDASEGGEVVLPPRPLWSRSIIIRKSVTLRGAGPALSTLNGEDKGPVVTVRGEVMVRIEGMTLTRGLHRVGAGLYTAFGASVSLVDCHLTHNRASTGRGGAVSTDTGALHLEKCTFQHNNAVTGGAINLGGRVKATIEDCAFLQNSAVTGGGLTVTDGAEVCLSSVRFDENEADREAHHLYAYGTAQRRPKITLDECVFGSVSVDGPSVVVSMDHPAEILLVGTTWPRDSKRGPFQRTHRLDMH